MNAAPPGQLGIYYHSPPTRSIWLPPDQFPPDLARAKTNRHQGKSKQAILASSIMLVFMKESVLHPISAR